MKKSIWLEQPEEHDYPAAQDYLEMVISKEDSEGAVKNLKQIKDIKIKKAKDILRASGNKLLPKTNIHVMENIKKVKKGNKLSPVLLVQHNNKLIIADGYHRVCAIYYLSEDLEVPCKLTWR